MQKERLQSKIEAIKAELEGADLMIGFYTWCAEQEQDKKIKSEYMIKVDQLKKTQTFNKKFLTYCETL